MPEYGETTLGTSVEVVVTVIFGFTESEAGDFSGDDFSGDDFHVGGGG